MKILLFLFHILLIYSIVWCADKGVYVGRKKDGKLQGQGTETYSDGSREKNYSSSVFMVLALVKELKN